MSDLCTWKCDGNQYCLFSKNYFPFHSLIDILIWQWREKPLYFLPISSSKCLEKRRQLIPHIFTLEKSLVSATATTRQDDGSYAKKNKQLSQELFVDCLPQCNASLFSVIGLAHQKIYDRGLHFELGEEHMTTSINSPPCHVRRAGLTDSRLSDGRTIWGLY